LFHKKQEDTISEGRRRNMTDNRISSIWSKEEDIKRYFKDNVYKDTCFRQLEYVAEKCIAEKSSIIPDAH
jgi:hypothetical protein